MSVSPSTFLGMTAKDWGDVTRTFVVLGIIYVLTAFVLWYVWGINLHELTSLKDIKDRKDFWLACAALVPAFLICQQGFYLHSLKPWKDWTTQAAGTPPHSVANPPQANEEALPAANGGAIPPKTDPPPATNGGSNQTDTLEGVPAARMMQLTATYGQERAVDAGHYLAAANQQAKKEFGILSISVDFFLPALLAAVAGGVVGFALSTIKQMYDASSPALAKNEEVYAGIVLGAPGAYVYVMMNLAHRTFLRDITPAIAVWSAVQLFIGPVLGGLVAAIWSQHTETAGVEFSHQVVYFFAGLAPREIIAIAQNMARRSTASAQAQQAPARLIPLQTVGGIDQSVADRLLEEGITDGYMLAMANPVRLFRNTPYDLRQILAWMDHCLLIATLPEYVDALRKAGVPGATALASVKEDADLTALATKIGLAKDLLKPVISRLAADAQQRRIFYLRESQDTDS